MSKNYGRKNAPRRNSHLLAHITIGLIAFVAGYGSAGLYDFAHFSAWVNQQLLAQQLPHAAKNQNAQHAAQLPKPNFEFYTLLANEHVGDGAQPLSVAKSSSAQPIVSAAQATLSTQGVAPTQTLSTAPKVAVASNLPVVPAGAAVLPPPANLATTQKLPLHAPLVATASEIKSSSYLVQVASFRNLREAERMKVSLVMKGFDVNIATVTQQHMSWYRVIIGPFSSRTQAQQMQLAFARREHIMGMVRKMDV